MTREELIELLNAVDKINDEIYAQLGEIIYWRWSYCVVEIGNNDVSIKMTGVNIWNSEDDDREWIEASSESYDPNGILRGFKVVPAHYELWDSYLRRKVNELVQSISKIKL